MDQEKITGLIKECAKSFRLDPNLCIAVATIETHLDPTLVRHEPKWKYLLNPAKYASNLGITLNTESVLQSMSWGCMQVMGSVCRELGFNGMMTLLVQPQLGIFYGCKKISLLCKKYTCEMDVISAYNQGGAYLTEEGMYKNQGYVNSVVEELNDLRGGNQ